GISKALCKSRLHYRGCTQRPPALDRLVQLSVARKCSGERAPEVGLQKGGVDSDVVFGRLDIGKVLAKCGLDHRVGHVWPPRMTSGSSNASCSGAEVCVLCTEATHKNA